MIIVSPCKGPGNCGFHIILISLLYLVIKSKTEPELLKEINNSEVLGEILSQLQDKSLKSQKNVDILNDQINQMISGKTSCFDFFSTMTEAMKKNFLKSDWLNNLVKNTLLAADWYFIPNNPYLNSEALQNLADKIKKYLFLSRTSIFEMNDEDSFKLVKKYLSSIDKSFFDELVKKVTFEIYGTRSAWLDYDFLTKVNEALFPNSKILFSKKWINLYNNASDDHWSLSIEKEDETLMILKQAIENFIEVSTCNKTIEFSPFL
ncbi:hypothetical protein [Legionella sp. WA2024007413]